MKYFLLFFEFVEIHALRGCGQTEVIYGSIQIYKDLHYRRNGDACEHLVEPEEHAEPVLKTAHCVNGIRDKHSDDAVFTTDLTFVQNYELKIIFERRGSYNFKA